MKQSRTYTPTETDRLTGLNVRRLRRLAGETLVETIDRSGVDMGQSSLSRIELGQRPLSLPDATKLAAHWNTTPGHLFVNPEPKQFPADVPQYTAKEWFGPAVQTEAAWLGNDKPLTDRQRSIAAYLADDRISTPRPIAPALHAVPGPDKDDAAAFDANFITIDRDAPLTPDEYRVQVWIPYLEARYTTEQKAG